MWYVRDVLYAVLYVRISCFVVRGCGVSKRYIDVCYCDMFGVVNVYLDHLKFCVVCINSRRYGCCSECDVVSNECNEPTSCLVQPIGVHCCEVMYYVFVKSSFKHTLKECESKRPMCFSCLIFNLSGPCELLFLFCFITSWTCEVVSVMLYPCMLCVALLMCLFVL